MLQIFNSESIHHSVKELKMTETNKKSNQNYDKSLLGQR